MATWYEWKVEEKDGDGDILDVHHYSTLGQAKRAAPSNPEEFDICLVWNQGDDCDGVTDRKHAYLDASGNLPEFFDEGGAVPKRFRKDN